MFRKITSLIVVAAFSLLSTVPPGAAQVIPALRLPAPGTMVGPGAVFTPALLKGINIHPDNPLRFDFIIDQGDAFLDEESFSRESLKMVKYFLAALTIPEEEMWVNLSPYEKDRVIPDSFGRTGMGRDLLAQDYMLKQIAASLTHPEEELGADFWQRLRDKVERDFQGGDDLPTEIFNKIWIVPEAALVYEHAKGAYVVESRLKVLLEEDYIALEANQGRTNHGVGRRLPDGNLSGGVGQARQEIITARGELTTETMREIIIPVIELEVNEGETFANLRQIYSAVILAGWYKKALKDSLLGQTYVDRHKTAGVEYENPVISVDAEMPSRGLRRSGGDIEVIYEQYLAAFSKGAYNFIREDYDPETRSVIPRRYFSGGASMKQNGAFLFITETPDKDFNAAAITGSEAKITTIDIRPGAGHDEALLSSAEDRLKNIYFPTMEKRIAPVKGELQPLVVEYDNLKPDHDYFSSNIIAKFVDRGIADKLKPVIREYAKTGGRRIGSLESLNEFKVDLGKDFDAVKKFAETAGGWKKNFYLLLNNYLRFQAVDGLINTIVDKINIDVDFETKLLDGELRPAQSLTAGDFKGLNNGKTYAGYLANAERMRLDGKYVPELLLAGNGTRLGLGNMYGVELWQQVVARAREGEKSEYSFGMGPRQMLAYRLSLDKLARKYGRDIKEVLQNQKMVIHINAAVEAEVLKDFQDQHFYGFDPQKVFFITQPDFSGYKLENGELVEDSGSDRLVYGHQDATRQMAEPGETYRINDQGRKEYLFGSFFDQLESDELVVTHRVNDLTKFSSDTVVDDEKLAMRLYLHDQGHHIVADLVANPLKTKGGTATNHGLFEGYEAKGSPLLSGFEKRQGDDGAPYNAFRLSYDPKARDKEVFSDKTYRYVLRFKGGFFYLDSATGQLTKNPQAKVAYIRREEEPIKDFKAVTPEQIDLVLEALRKQDDELRENGITPQSFSGVTGNKTLITNPGGIDLNPLITNLDIRRGGAGFVLPPVDPEMLDQFENVTGVAPVIINVAPAMNLPALLGLTDNTAPEREANDALPPADTRDKFTRRSKLERVGS